MPLRAWASPGVALPPLPPRTLKLAIFRGFFQVFGCLLTCFVLTPLSEKPPKICPPLPPADANAFKSDNCNFRWVKQPTALDRSKAEASHD